MKTQEVCYRPCDTAAVAGRHERIERRLSGIDQQAGSGGLAAEIHAAFLVQLGGKG